MFNYCYKIECYLNTSNVILQSPLPPPSSQAV